MIFSVLALTVYGQLMIKARSLVNRADVAEKSDAIRYIFSMFTDFWVWTGLIGAGVAAICYMLALERMDVSYAYPFMALSFVAVPIGSALLLGESLPPLQVLGLGLIVAGVSISALSR